MSRASRRPHLGSVARGDHVLPLRSSRPYHHFLTSYLHHPAVQYRSQPLRVLSRRVPLHSQGEYHYTAYAKVLPIQAWSSLRCERILPRFSFVRCPPSCFNLARRRSSTEQYGAVRPNKVSRRTEKVLAEMALRSPLQCNPGFWRFRTIFPIMRVQVRSFISSTEYARMIGDRQRRINAGTVKPVS